MGCFGPLKRSQMNVMEAAKNSASCGLGRPGSMIQPGDFVKLCVVARWPLNCLAALAIGWGLV
jgi:hypothetical protein